MIMQDNEKKPALRFKGFTDPWEQRKLGEIAKEVVRNDPASDAPIMMITAGNGFIEQSDRYAFNNAGESLKKYILLECGELAYNHGASKLRPYGSCFALTTVEKARIPFVYHCFSVEKSNPEFLSIELNGANVENQLRKIVSSGARMDGLLNIAYSEYTEVTVQLPKKEEQDWIAKFFKHLDTLITLHQRKYEKLVNIKKSMLDKMFPKNGASVPEIRFKGFTDPWEQRKLEEYLEVSGQKNFEGIYTKEDVLSVSGDFGIVNQIEFQGRSFAGASVANYGVVETGDIVYTKSPLKSNPYGIIKANKGKNGIVSTLYAVYKPKQSANPEFVQIYFEQDARMNNYMHPLVNKGAKNDMKVSAENALKGQIVFPDIKEQRTISEFFRNLDTLITLHQRKLEKLQNIKKSCLEKMFV
jgi:type I restriction enzyme S subunit